MKNRWILYLMTSLSLLGLWSCSESQDSGQLIEDEAIQEEVVLEEDVPQQFFQMPSPVELFMFMWEDGAPFNVANLNSIEKVDTYVESKKKAINLGVYSADLAYSTIYDKNKETMNLFSVTKKLADDLGLTEGFDKSILERVDRNIENSDSLLHITNDSYSKTITFLQSQGQIHILPYIIYGGWLESVYIATQTIKKYHPESNIATRIADQNILLENLIEFFQSLPKSDEEAQEILKDLDALSAIYQKSLDSEEAVMSEDTYMEVKAKISSLRESIVE